MARKVEITVGEIDDSTEVTGIEGPNGGTSVGVGTSAQFEICTGQVKSSVDAREGKEDCIACALVTGLVVASGAPALVVLLLFSVAVGFCSLAVGFSSGGSSESASASSAASDIEEVSEEAVAAEGAAAAAAAADAATSRLATSAVSEAAVAALSFQMSACLLQNNLQGLTSYGGGE